MLPIHSVLASGNPVLQWLPYILIGICVFALLIGFIHGFKRGSRLVSWNGLVWVIAALAFFLLVRFYGGVSPFASKLTFLGEKESVFVGNILLAVLCVVFALVFYALFSSLFPEQYSRVLSDDERHLYRTYEIEMDELSADYDDYKEYAPNAEPEYRLAEPSGFERVLGGIFAMANVLAFVIAIMSGLLLVIDCTALKNVATSLYEVKLGEVVVMDACLNLIARFGMDFLFIGITIGVAFKGKRRGLMESFRRVLVRWVGFALILIALYLPFSPYATYENGLIGKVVGACIGFMPEVLGSFAPLVGKLCAALIFIAVVIIVRILVDRILRLLVKAVRSVDFFDTVDSSLSCLAYVIVGVIVCVLIWGGLYVLDYYNLFTAANLFSENATISQGLFDMMETHLNPILNTVTETVKGILAKFGL